MAAEAPDLLFVPLLSTWAVRSGEGGRDKYQMSRFCKLDIACEHRTSTRIRAVGQGVTKKGAKFGMWRQTDFLVICTVVSLIQLHENPQNLIQGLKS